MNSAIAVFFASLISGALSLADFRPALSDMVQILTGVQMTQQKNASGSNQQVYDTPASQTQPDNCLPLEHLQADSAIPDCQSAPTNIATPCG